MIKMAPLSDLTVTEIRDATAGDAALQTVARFTQRGWPENKSDVPSGLLPYFRVRDELSVEKGLLFRVSRVIIPESMYASTRQKLHAAHLGVNACL